MIFVDKSGLLGASQLSCTVPTCEEEPEMRNPTKAIRGHCSLSMVFLVDFEIEALRGVEVLAQLRPGVWDGPELCNPSSFVETWKRPQFAKALPENEWSVLALSAPLVYLLALLFKLARVLCGVPSLREDLDPVNCECFDAYC